MKIETSVTESQNLQDLTDLIQFDSSKKLDQSYYVVLLSDCDIEA